MEAAGEEDQGFITNERGRDATPAAPPSLGVGILTEATDHPL